ncbi:hypothetical protein ABT160_04615 [Streptomyces sp. NPDC001941]|uniref:hypothetical protein n=1 Tax=Streptomyces sp. NPDC001941 TaxID=3154659 RepID=UPI0033284E4F
MAEEKEMADVATIALQFAKLAREGNFWAGGPLSSGALNQVATAVTQSSDAAKLLEGIRVSENPEKLLQGFLAIWWAQGFNVGAMYAEKHGADA